MAEGHSNILAQAKAKQQRGLDTLRGKLGHLQKEKKSLEGKLQKRQLKFGEVSKEIERERESSKSPGLVWNNVFHLNQELTTCKEGMLELWQGLETLQAQKTMLSKQAQVFLKRIDVLDRKEKELLVFREIKKAYANDVALTELRLAESLRTPLHLDREGATNSSVQDMHDISSNAVPLSALVPQALVVQPEGLSHDTQVPESQWARMQQMMTEAADRIRRERLDTGKLSFSFQSEEGEKVVVEVERQMHEAMKIVLIPSRKETFTVLESDRHHYVSQFAQHGIALEEISVRKV
ncbi:MAG: hypothetical protein KDD62_13570 [Bdellovibrionales bacterium]|nr:hypothetical protein [Bdellovibrionales bacterium]